MSKKSTKPESQLVNVADPAACRPVNLSDARNIIDIRFEPKRKSTCLKALHGITGFVPLRNGGMAYPVPILKMLRELHLPYSYFHDASLEQPGQQVVDVSCIFPIFSADPQNPDNYCFRETDEYLRRVIDSGLKVIFRLGESIEVGTPQFRVLPPEDPEKWATICLNIARHYNEGWGNGYCWNIQDWAVWEEPNNPNLWAGKFQDYLNLYAILTRQFKHHNPQWNVGGPETTTLGFRFWVDFLEFCRREQLLPDFISYTAYFRTPSEFLAETQKRRHVLDDYGFRNVPLWITEWHACPIWESRSDIVGYRREYERIGGVDGAVFAAAVLCGLQDCPVERACFYAAVMGGGYGIFDLEHLPTPVYYVFQLFCKMFDRSVRRMALKISNGNPDIQALASVNEKGGIDLLIGAYIQSRKQIRLEIPQNYSIQSVNILDESNRHFHESNFNHSNPEKRILEISKPEGSAAFFIELTPCLS